MKRYGSEKEIRTVIDGFESGTIARSDWRHAEHLTMALHYLTENEFEMALAKMRRGIFNLLGAFGVDLSKEMPFHETLTVFWMMTVADFMSATNGMPLLEKTNAMVEKFDKDYPLRFYSREFLFSDEARAKYVEPDILSNQKESVI